MGPGPAPLFLTALAFGLFAAGRYFYKNYNSNSNNYGIFNFEDYFGAPNEIFVKTSLGVVQGSYTITRGGKSVRQFLGIRYAKPPVGELSFQNPVEPDPWVGVRDATIECSMCMQQFVMVEELRKTVVGIEDCLCVNIYTPKVSSTEKYPVIFFIHGGGYLGLSAAKSFYGPEMMLDRDVVLVTVNYRLGVLGFLSTEDTVIPGNWGLKDQAAALRWVQRNILQFGGDPNSITLMGQDTGAGSVHLHMQSYLTKDLFHRAVMHSGSALCLWGFSEPGIIKARSKKVADLIGCPFEPSEVFLECLRKTDSRLIVDTTRSFLIWDSDPFAFWNPVVEDPNAEGAFLVHNPYKITSKKPLLAGFNYGEGMMKVSGLFSGDDINSTNAKFEEWNRWFYRYLPISLLFDTIKSPHPWWGTLEARDFYFGPYFRSVRQFDIPQINRMYGDFLFTNGLLDAVERHSGPKYLYHFNYNTTASVCSIIYNTKVYEGACHSDELMYLFPMGMNVDNFINPASADYMLSVQMVDLWTNFATNSQPTANEITWDPVMSPSMEYLEIRKDGFSMKANPIPDRRKYWKKSKLTDIKSTI